MNCNEAKALLYDYLRKETTPLQAGDIKAHLAECRACEKELAGIKHVQTILTSNMKEPSKKVISALRTHFKLSSFFGRFLSPKPVLAFAILLLIAGGGLFTGFNEYNKRSALHDFFLDSYKVIDQSDSYEMAGIDVIADTDQDQEIF